MAREAPGLLQQLPAGGCLQRPGKHRSVGQRGHPRDEASPQLWRAFGAAGRVDRRPADVVVRRLSEDVEAKTVGYNRAGAPESRDQRHQPRVERDLVVGTEREPARVIPPRVHVAGARLVRDAEMSGDPRGEPLLAVEPVVVVDGDGEDVRTPTLGQEAEEEARVPAAAER